MAKEVNLKVGFEDQLKDITVEIPDDAPKPWDATDKLKYIGKPFSRVDGRLKATGEAIYTFDVRLPGMLYGKFLRSKVPAAVIRNIDTSKAERVPGVKAIVRVQEELPIIVRFAGQEILAVAAETVQQAEEAIRLIDVKYENRSFVIDKDRAMQSSSPTVFDTKVEEQTSAGDIPQESEEVKQKGNVRGPQINGVDEGEVDAALGLSEVVVEETYRTQVQTHSPLETHGVVAHWEGRDKLLVYASTQGTFTVRNELAEVLELPKSNVRVITDMMGGGFGAKFGAGVYGVTAARLAKKASAPVRMMLDRKEQHLCVGNRPDSAQTLKIGATRDGKLTAIKLLSYGTAGVGTGAGTSGPARNIYDCPAIHTQESDVFINAGPGAAFRAPGHPQGAFALEQAIDELAYKLNLNPLDFRKMNTRHHPIRQRELEIGSAKFGWDKRNPQVAADRGPIKRGVGIANSVWYYIYGPDTRCTVQVNNDGSVEFHNGVQDIGTGIRTVLAMVVAEELSLRPQDISVKIGDTSFGMGPASGGSRTTASITPAARDAAYRARLRMLDIAAPLLETTADQLDLAEGKIFVKSAPAKSLTWKEVAKKIPGGEFKTLGERARNDRQFEPGTTAGVQFAEVEVDTETGVVKVIRVLAVHDCGRVMDKLTTESQIHGGVIQGISYALFENRLLDRNEGIMVNANYDQYKIAGSLDTPKIESVLLDVNHGQSSTGAVGIGEPATVATSGAVANAIYHAIGARVRELPMTPDKVLSALNAFKGGATS